MKPAAAKLALAEERLLIRELSHRIVNEFASLTSMISLAAARAANAEASDALEAVLCRLHGYIRVHRALQMPQPGELVDASAYLRELCRAMSSSKLERRKIRLIFIERPLVLSSEQAWLLGMIVYELINNAVRHAFDEAGDAAGGEIRLAVEHTRGLVECQVSDNGAPPVAMRRGRGLRIIKDLASRLHGRFDQQFLPGGSISLLVFPSATFTTG